MGFKDKVEAAKESAKGKVRKGACQFCGEPVKKGYNTCQDCMTGKKISKNTMKKHLDRLNDWQ